MQKLAREYLDELNKRHRKNRKAILAWVLLAVLVISTVAGSLTQYGSALTEKGNPACGQEEHTHDETCYTYEEQLTCGMEEDGGHSHGGDCYGDPELTCGMEESADHAHEDACYGEPALVCGQDEGEGHSHTDVCYTETETLSCGKEEHVHSGDCFSGEVPAEDEEINDNNSEGSGTEASETETSEAEQSTAETESPAGTTEADSSESESESEITSEAESTETESAEEESTEVESTEEGLTEEEQAQVDEVIALIDALPSPEEIMEKFSAFQDAGDEDGYDAYYEKLSRQAAEAKKAYDKLTEEQKLAVTNAEALFVYEWLWTGTLEETTWDIMRPDEAYVNEIKISSIATGSAPFDETEGRGNDTTAEDNLVRTFDTVTYHFNVNMKTWDLAKSYGQARVKLEFVLPVSEQEAVFEQTAMAWMDQTEGYQPVVTKETRTVNGEQKECQVLTCHKLLLPSEGNHSVVPGDFGENLTIFVRSMKNGETFAPIISAAMEGGAWDGPCDKEEHKIDGQPAVEKKSVTADEVEITAAPKYNIQVKGDSSYAADFYFQGDEAWMAQYKDIAANTDIVKPLPGRAMKLGITLQLYNDNASKGLKGIELPDGGDITFDLKLSSKYTINTPKEGSGYQVDQVIEDAAYAPLLWSYNEVDWKDFGSQNKDGRQIDDRLKATPYAPYNKGGGKTACYNGGSWTASQEGDTIHITVSGYEIDTQKMPTLNGDGGTLVTYGPNVGCFSSGEIWLIQPFNKKEGDGIKPNYDIVDTYGEGSFATTAEAGGLKVTTISGETMVQGENGFQQMVTDDDRETRTLELTVGGYLQNRVRYADAKAFELGCGVEDNRDGRDYAAVGTELNLMGGLSYNPNRIEENRMYLGTTLLKFYGSALELEKEDWFLHLEGGAALNGYDENNIEKAEENVRFYYATKKDGSDWSSDEELKTTYEDSLEFYDSLDQIPKGKTCVGMLICFVGPGSEVTVSDPYYRCYYKAKVRDDMDLAGQTFMLASTSRVWTKEMFEKLGMSPGDIDLQENPDLNLPKLILGDKLWNCGHYTSANIDGSIFYTKETYRPDGSGIEGTHNSDWYHWGDTLLIIGYKTKITKNLLQTDEKGEEKKTFNLDADQRVADFKLQPETYYDRIYQGPEGSEDQFKNTANITIVDTLPKYMTYKPGSAYFGGKYEQTSKLGGVKGNIVVDSDDGALFPDPVPTEPAVVTNSDGTQTLTWVIKDVTIGKPMAPIYYSTDIGVKGNPEQDIPTGTTDLENVVYITTPRDIRDPMSTAEKHAKAGITVVRGSASSFGKYTRQKVVDEDGIIDYMVYFNNNADTGAVVGMMDTMPANGKNGSHFTGTYTFAEWKLDTGKCDPGKLAIYYTFDEAYQDKTTKDVPVEEIETWERTTISADGTIAIPAGTQQQPHPAAWAVIGALEPHKSVNIELKIKLEPGVSDNDKKNNYFVNLLSSGDTTTITETPTVRRTLEGLTWMDYNRDGIQNDLDTEVRISGIKVELLKLKENGNPEEEASYENVCYPNTDTPIAIETGQQISVRAASGEKPGAYEAGCYKFTDLPAGTFAVRFTNDGDTKISALNATKRDSGYDDTIDSDGMPVYDEADPEKLVKTVILNLEMPKAEEMSVSLYESKFHDSGFYPDTLMKLRKVDESGNQPLSDAVFTIRDSRGQTVPFTYKEGEGYTAYTEEEADPALIGKYYIAFASDPSYVVEINGNWDGAVPVLKKRNGNSLQLFEVKEQGGDLKSFLNVGSGKWLDLDGGKKYDGAKIHVWSNNEPNDNQKWRVTDAGAGSYIWPSTAGSANEWHMDLSGGEPRDGETIHLWSANDTPAQKWILVPAVGNVSSEKVETQADLSVDASGSLTIHNLIPGDYTLSEIKSPAGYSLLKEPVKFTMNTDGTVSLGSNNGVAGIEAEDGKNIILKVKNIELYELPSTGGIGTYWYTIGGTLLMMAAALILYKKKHAEEVLKIRG